MLNPLHAHGRQADAAPADTDAARRPVVTPTPAGSVVAAISALQASAGNRATARLLAGRSAGRRALQRDALATQANDTRPAVDAAAGEVDPARIGGAGELGARASQWAETGTGGDGPAPPIPSAAGGATTGAGDAGSAAAGGGTATGEQASNLPADVTGGSGIALAGNTGQQGGSQGAGQAGPTGSGVRGPTGGQASGPGQAGQATGAGPVAGGTDWTQRPEGAAVVKLLSASSIGQEAIATATRYGVVVMFQAKGRPAAYDAGDNHCYLDPATATNELATYFVHEMHHARQSQQGLSPLPDKAPDREAWVDAMVQEETKATWLSFEARVEAGIATPLGSGPLADAWTQYLRVRRYWREEHLKSSPNDTAGADALAIAKGRALIQYLIVGDPNSRTLPGLGPDQFSSYAMFYRRQWNIAHGGRP